MDKPIIYNPDKLLWLPENYNEDMITKSFRLQPTSDNFNKNKNKNPSFKNDEITEDIIYLKEIIYLENELKELRLQYNKLFRNYKYVLKVNKIYEKVHSYLTSCIK